MVNLLCLFLLMSMMQLVVQVTEGTADLLEAGKFYSTVNFKLTTNLTFRSEKEESV